MTSAPRNPAVAGCGEIAQRPAPGETPRSALELAERHGIPHEVEGNCRYITSDPAAAQFAGAGGTPAVTLKVPALS